MNYKMTGRFLSQIIFLEAVFLVPALIISLCLQEQTAALAIAASMGIMILVAGILWLFCRHSLSQFSTFALLAICFLDP